jgi:hypothetical protein
MPAIPQLILKLTTSTTTLTFVSFYRIKIEAISVAALFDVGDISQYDVIAIDEGQFVCI